MQMIPNERLRRTVHGPRRNGNKKEPATGKFFRLPIGLVRSRARGQMNLAFRLGASREVLCMHCGLAGTVLGKSFWPLV